MTCSILAALRGIEKLGGSAGYQQYLETADKFSNLTHIAALSNFTRTATSTNLNNVVVSGSLWTALVYTSISLTGGGYSGSGHAWGLGVADIHIAGDLMYTSWDDLMAGENKFNIIAATVDDVGATVAEFSVNGAVVAYLVMAGVGFGDLVGIDGTFQWK